MYLTQIPFYPAHKVQYQLDEMQGDADQLAETFPEITKCVGCNACSNVCPQDIKVMKYIAHAIRGEISKAADESFDCLMCGLCATKCPANILQYKVALLSRRLHSRYMVPEAEHLQDRLKEIGEGKYDAELEKLMKANREDLADQYNNRDIE